MQLGLWTDHLFDSSSEKQQQQCQAKQTIVAVDEVTFSHLPKRSEAIGLSSYPATGSPSKYYSPRKGYKRFGLFLRDLDPVSFDPTVDPSPRTCYNCWSSQHTLRKCPRPLTDVYCCNCGRRYVTIEQCPRCARPFWNLDDSARQWLSSYISCESQGTDYNDKSGGEFENDRRVEFNTLTNVRKDTFGKTDSAECQDDGTLILKVDNNKEESARDWWECSKVDNKAVEKSLNAALMEKEKDKLDNDDSPLDNECKGENLQATDAQVDPVVKNGEHNSFGETLIVSQLDENDDEDYDDIIVDEDENTETPFGGDTVPEFLDLLKALKFLPIQQQNQIVLRFISERKKKICQE